MDATVILADWAEAINGKLYIQGGGWSRVPVAAGPIYCALAVKLSVPWNDANTMHRLIIRLVDADGRVVTPEQSPPVEIETTFEVGRPPGLVPGTELDVPLTSGFRGLPLPVGRYRFQLEIDNEVLPVGASFEVFE